MLVLGYADTAPEKKTHKRHNADAQMASVTEFPEGGYNR